MRFVHLLTAVLLIVLPGAIYASALATGSDSESQHIIYKKKPILMPLPVGIERMITFPSQVKVSIASPQASVTTDMLQIMNNDGTLYLTAKKAFPKTGLLVHSVIGDDASNFGKTYLIDVIPVNSGPENPLVIIDKNDVKVRNRKKIYDQSVDESSSIISLNRYVLQQLYSPQRLRGDATGIYRVPMHTQKTVHLLTNHNVIAMPLASWHSGSLYTTAVLIRNMNDYSVQLSPSEILGRWQSCLFYPKQKLLDRYSKADTTTVLLTSSAPFNQALSGFGR